MIRVRDTKGNVRVLPPEERFVEICDDDGVVAFAVFQDERNRVVILEPDTPEGERYARVFKIVFAKQVTLPKFLTEINV